MKVIYMSSDLYAMYTGVSIVSMLKNNADDKSIEFVLLDDGLTEENREKILSIFQSYNVDCDVLSADNCYKQAAKRVSNSLRVYNGARTGWLRLFPDELFPDYLGDVMYVDSDTIIDGPLKELHTIDWGDKMISACNVPQYMVGNVTDGIEEEERIREKRGGSYLNSGIVVYNMRNFKKFHGAERIDRSIDRLQVFRYIEQTVLNDAFSGEDVLPLPVKYNFTLHVRPKYSKQRAYLGVDGAEEKPIIIHYPGWRSRPWFRESTSTLAHKFTEYQTISPWKGIEESYFDSRYYLQMPLIKRIRERLIVRLYNTHIFAWLFDKRYSTWLQ